LSHLHYTHYITIITFRQCGYVFALVCSSVGSITPKIFTNFDVIFSAGVGRVTSNKWLDFGGDLDDNANPEICR